MSTYHLAVQIRGNYQGMMIAAPPGCWPPWHSADPSQLAAWLLHLARNVNPRQVATNTRKPKPKALKDYVDGATARICKQAETGTP